MQDLLGQASANDSSLTWPIAARCFLVNTSSAIRRYSSAVTSAGCRIIAVHRHAALSLVLKAVQSAPTTTPRAGKINFVVGATWIV